ncbi:hypothetical protein [Saccharopolyspora aridisoli]|uniref:hypothetical protein n=1 Tax=Saccharopolyspora aridisoli TaxID=2530385 RepID=UPI0014052D2D|nr:hypothetical protein [Saccharopolyspora aridisoli]
MAEHHGHRRTRIAVDVDVQRDPVGSGHECGIGRRARHIDDVAEGLSRVLCRRGTTLGGPKGEAGQ